MRIVDFGNVTFRAGRNNQLFTQNAHFTPTPIPVPQRVTNLNVVHSLNQAVENSKIAYSNTHSNSNNESMETAAKLAGEFRNTGTNIGSTVNTSAVNSSKNYYEQSGIKIDITTRSAEDINNELRQVNNKYAWAKAHNDLAGMEASSELASNMRALGGTIGADVTIDDAKKMVDEQSHDTNQNDSFLDKLNQHMAGVVDGAKDDATNTLSAITHLPQTIDSVIHDVTHPQETVSKLKDQYQQFVDDWNSGNTYGVSKSLAELIFNLIGVKGAGLPEDAANTANDILKSTIGNVKDAGPFTQIVLSDGSKVVVPTSTLKSNDDLANYLLANVKNGGLANQTHPVTGVPFNSDGFPVFDSTFDATIDPSLYTSSDRVQFKEANKQLFDAIKKNPNLAEQFIKEQLKDIANGITPKGYTWHHNQEEGKLQLVNTDTHSKTGHTGGRSLWGGGSSNR